VNAGPAVTVRIKGLSGEGDGTVRVDGREITVPHVIPGEKVEVRIERRRGGRAEGRVLEILEASPHRVTPRCRHFGPCGGCAWQHIDYGEQLRLKTAILQDLLDRSAGPGTEVLRTVPSPAGRGGDGTPWGYRQKVSFVFAPADRPRSLVMGHYRRGSGTVLPVVECPVHSPTGNEVAFALRDALLAGSIPAATRDGSGGVARHVVVRVSSATGDWLTTLVVTGNPRELRRVTARFLKTVGADEGKAEGRTGFHLNLHAGDDPFLFGDETRRLYGASEIRERVAGVTFLLAPTAFFQTNTAIAAAIVEHVLDVLPADRFPRVLDLYSGVGLFALPLAARGASVVAVEENRDGVAAAESGRRFNRLPEERLRLVRARVEESLSRLISRSPSNWPDAVILDPPRQGCPPPVLELLLRRLEPRRIVYVSCNPEALARDVARALKAGYAADPVLPFDMFPHTSHIESVAVLNKRSAG
jgi:23S rRNA (uracil1939-C5)-methyltransferase